jgi:hypothetical protein
MMLANCPLGNETDREIIFFPARRRAGRETPKSATHHIDFSVFFCSFDTPALAGRKTPLDG